MYLPSQVGGAAIGLILTSRLCNDWSNSSILCNIKFPLPDDDVRTGVTSNICYDEWSRAIINCFPLILKSL